jgi:hypothetical protein
MKRRLAALPRAASRLLFRRSRYGKGIHVRHALARNFCDGCRSALS